MSVIVHTGNPASPVLVFGEADSFRPLDELGNESLSVMNGDVRIASFRHWDSAAIVDQATAAAFAYSSGLSCKRCDDREARFREAINAQTPPKSSDG